MTHRERKLAIAVGGVFAVLLFYTLVQRLVINRIYELRDRIASQLKERDALRAQVDLGPQLRRLHGDLSRRMLGADPDKVRNRLDRVMKQLLEDAGISGYSAGPGAAQYDRVAKLWRLPYTVITADATMEAFARFLYGFYQQPYAMKITSFNLQPVSSRRSQLKLSGLQVEALLLASEGATASGPDSQPAAQPAGPWRSVKPDLNAYALLWTRKFMEPYAPAPPPPPPAPSPPVLPPTLTPPGGPFQGPVEVSITTSTAGAKIRYTLDGTDPTPAAGLQYTGTPIRVAQPGTVKAIAYLEDGRTSPVATAAFAEPPPLPLRLVALVSYGPVSEALLVNEQTKQGQWVREGDPFDKGRLLLVLPDAAVVEAPDGQRYVYWLGRPVQQREPLDPVRHPNVSAAVQVLVETP